MLHVIRRFQLTASAYLSKFKVPTLNVISTDNKVFIRKSNFRMSHRIVRKRRFYPSTEPLFDINMVEGDDDERPPTTNELIRI